jgi:putative transposase
MTSVQELIPTHGAVAACEILGLPRGAPARHRARARRAAFVGPRPARRARPRPPMALDVLENQALLDTLNSERFMD